MSRNHFQRLIIPAINNTFGKEGGSYIQSGVEFKKFHVMASSIAGDT